MKLKPCFLAIVLALTSLVASANEKQVENESTYSHATCWWIFCKSAPKDPIPLGIGTGDPPGPDLQGIGLGDPPGPKPKQFQQF